MENEIRKLRLGAETGENDAALRLLVVDDDEADRLAVRRLLKTSDVHTVIDEASSSHEALEHLARGKYDCVLLDYYIPGAAGHSLFRIKRHQSNPDLGSSKNGLNLEIAGTEHSFPISAYHKVGSSTLSAALLGSACQAR